MKRSELPAHSPGHQQASAAVSAALGTLPYPISKKEAIRKVGDWKVPYGHEAEIPLAQLLEAIPTDELRDPGEAAKTVDRYWGRISKTFEAVEAAERRTKSK